MARIATFYDHIRDIAREKDISFEKALEAAANLGIQALEVSQNNLLGREKEVRRELSAAGMCISAVAAYFDFGRCQDVDSQADPVLEAAAALGAEKMLVIPGFFRPEDGPEVREQQVQAMEECICRLGEKASGFGIPLVMEDYDSDLAPFSTAAGVRRFLDSCPCLNCCFDTGNFRFSAEEETAAYQALRDRITHVHLKDRAYTGQAGERFVTARDGQALYASPAGAGEIAMEALLASLKEDGYDGTYAIEHYGAPAPLAYLERSVQWLKQRL